mmetsp:Transcript_69665/g.202172  ORF Transcript_69665/g.202172 Transcript_69665/m.202172 type:complete len:378 (-) Transcript_69665:512-1645(-)
MQDRHALPFGPWLRRLAQVGVLQRRPHRRVPRRLLGGGSLSCCGFLDVHCIRFGLQGRPCTCGLLRRLQRVVSAGSAVLDADNVLNSARTRVPAAKAIRWTGAGVGGASSGGGLISVHPRRRRRAQRPRRRGSPSGGGRSEGRLGSPGGHAARVCSGRSGGPGCGRGGPHRRRRGRGGEAVRHGHGERLRRYGPPQQDILGSFAHRTDLVALQSLQRRRDPLLQRGGFNRPISRQWDFQRSAELRIVAHRLQNLNRLLACLPIGGRREAALEARHQGGQHLIELCAVHNLQGVHTSSEQLRLGHQERQVQVLNQARTQPGQVLPDDDRRGALNHLANARRGADLHRLVVLAQGIEQRLQQGGKNRRAFDPVQHQRSR